MDHPHSKQPVLEAGLPLHSAKGAVVMLHGRGASAEDILSLAAELDHPNFAYLAPQAAGHTWYPYSFLSPINQNQPWLDSALMLVGEIVERIVKAGIPRQKIVLLGFSQGACLSTEFVARNAQHYGGLIAFTGGLIGPPGTKFNYSGDLAGTLCLLAAGDPDPHVPWERVAESANVLSGLGGAVTLKRYPGMPHTINQQEIKLAQGIMEKLVT
jgi:phospholipase/carboxylesterase